MTNKNPHDDIARLLEAALFVMEKTTHGGEIYWQFKPGEKGKLDIKTYGFTSGKVN
jgi:hypothetical protein